MSSQLSLFNASSSSKSEEINLKDIDTLVGKGDQHWFKRARVGIFLELPQIVNSIRSLDLCEKRSREELGTIFSTINGCSGPKDEKNKMDNFISVYVVMYVIVNFCKNKGKVLKEHILKDIVPRGCNAKIVEIQEEHQQGIEQGYNQIETIQFENVCLGKIQGKIQANDQEMVTLERCYVKRG